MDKGEISLWFTITSIRCPYQTTNGDDEDVGTDSITNIYFSMIYREP